VARVSSREREGRDRNVLVGILQSVGSHFKPVYTTAPIFEDDLFLID
jgi:hypothetical protein